MMYKLKEYKQPYVYVYAVSVLSTKGKASSFCEAYPSNNPCNELVIFFWQFVAFQEIWKAQ